MLCTVDGSATEEAGGTTVEPNSEAGMSSGISWWFSVAADERYKCVVKVQRVEHIAYGHRGPAALNED